MAYRSPIVSPFATMRQNNFKWVLLTILKLFQKADIPMNDTSSYRSKRVQVH